MKIRGRKERHNSLGSRIRLSLYYLEIYWTAPVTHTHTSTSLLFQSGIDLEKKLPHFHKIELMINGRSFGIRIKYTMSACSAHQRVEWREHMKCESIILFLSAELDRKANSGTESKCILSRHHEKGMLIWKWYFRILNSPGFFTWFWNEAFEFDISYL